MPGVITCGLGEGEGDPVGICMPGVITCGLGEGEGDAVGICMLGVITCGLGEACGLTLVGFRLVGRRALARVRRFGAALGFGFAAAGFFGMTCPSC